MIYGAAAEILNTSISLRETHQLSKWQSAVLIPRGAVSLLKLFGGHLSSGDCSFQQAGSCLLALIVASLPLLEEPCLFNQNAHLWSILHSTEVYLSFFRTLFVSSKSRCPKFMAMRMWGLATASAVVIGAAVLYSAVPTAEAAPSPPEPCGTLDLSSPLTQHCE